MAKRQEVSKDDIYWRVLNAAIDLDLKKGHLKWTLSDVSRKSNVTRSLIYYYFGRSKLSLLEEAVKLIGDEVVGLTDKRVKMWQEGKYVESLIHARSFCDKSEKLSSFIIEHIKNETEIGLQLRQVEDNFKKKISSFFPVSSPAQIDAIYAMYFGAAFCPNLNRDAMEYMVKGLMLIIKGLQEQNPNSI